MNALDFGIISHSLYVGKMNFFCKLSKIGILLYNCLFCLYMSVIPIKYVYTKIGIISLSFWLLKKESLVNFV